MKKEKEIIVHINFTEGWEERFAKAAYELYLSVEGKSSNSIKSLEPQSL